MIGSCSFAKLPFTEKFFNIVPSFKTFTYTRKNKCVWKSTHRRLYHCDLLRLYTRVSSPRVWSVAVAQQIKYMTQPHHATVIDQCAVCVSRCRRLVCSCWFCCYSARNHVLENRHAFAVYRHFQSKSGTIRKVFCVCRSVKVNSAQRPEIVNFMYIWHLRISVHVLVGDSKTQVEYFSYNNLLNSNMALILKRI